MQFIYLSLCEFLNQIVCMRKIHCLIIRIVKSETCEYFLVIRMTMSVKYQHELSSFSNLFILVFRNSVVNPLGPEIFWWQIIAPSKLLFKTAIKHILSLSKVAKESN